MEKGLFTLEEAKHALYMEFLNMAILLERYLLLETTPMNKGKHYTCKWSYYSS